MNRFLKWPLKIWGPLFVRKQPYPKPMPHFSRAFRKSSKIQQHGYCLAMAPFPRRIAKQDGKKKQGQNILKIKYHRSACHTDLLWYFLIYSWPILDAHVLKNGNSLWRHWHAGVDRIWTRQKSVLKWEDHWNVHIPSTSGWCYMYIYICIYIYMYM